MAGVLFGVFMKAVVSAKELKTALKALKNIVDSFQDIKTEFYYGFNVTDKGLCLQAIGSLYASYCLTSQYESFDFFTPVDPSLLSTFKFPEDEIKIEIKDSALKAVSGSFEVELALPHMTAPPIKLKEIPLVYKFEVESFTKALNFHTYGIHHNPIEASKRVVSLRSGEGKLHLQSFDKQVSAFNSLPSLTNIEDVIYLTPKPVLSALNDISDKEIHFGVSKQFWRICSDKLDVYYPNMVKPVVGNFSSILTEMETKPCIKVGFKKDLLKKSLMVLAPSIKAGKEDNPKMYLYVQDSKVSVTVSSDRIKSMKFDLEADVQPDRLLLDGTALGVNFRYTKEFVDKLDGDLVYFQYWKYQDDNAPLKGRVLSFYNDYGRYIIGRISL